MCIRAQMLSTSMAIKPRKSSIVTHDLAKALSRLNFLSSGYIANDVFMG